MDFKDYLTVLRNRWMTLVGVALTTLAATAVITLLVTPQYTATARMFFSVQGGESISDLTQGSTFTEKQMSSYAEVARSPLVIDAVIDELDLDVTAEELSDSVNVRIPANTVILEIAARDEDPRVTSDIANSVASQLSIVAGELSPDRPDGTESVRATVLTPAAAPNAPSFPNTKLNLAIGSLLGLALGFGAAIIRELLDTKVRKQEDVEKVTDFPVIGSVAYAEGASNSPVFMHSDPLSERAEAIRRIRTNLQFVDLTDKPNSIVVTSSVPGEGKSTTTVNLAISLADAGARVALVDADLRRPSIGQYMGLEERVGLTTVLIGRASLADVLQPWRDTTLDVLPSGQIPPNPSELLGSRAMHSLLAQLAESHDIVLIDSPPLLPVTDAAILSKHAGGTLVIAGADRIHKAQLAQTFDALTKVNGRVLGIVLNKVERSDRGRYSYEAYSPQQRTVGTPQIGTNGKRTTWPGRPLTTGSR